MPTPRKFDLEDRLVAFSCLCLDICDLLPNTRAGNNLEHQLAKRGTALSLNYGEAQAAESAGDFVHKMKVCLKEIRETKVNLRIIKEKPLVKGEVLDKALDEVNQLLAIFIKSIDTAKANKDRVQK